MFLNGLFCLWGSGDDKRGDSSYSSRRSSQGVSSDIELPSSNPSENSSLGGVVSVRSSDETTVLSSLDENYWQNIVKLKELESLFLDQRSNPLIRKALAYALRKLYDPVEDYRCAEVIVDLEKNNICTLRDFQKFVFANKDVKKFLSWYNEAKYAERPVNLPDKLILDTVKSKAPLIYWDAMQTMNFLSAAELAMNEHGKTLEALSAWMNIFVENYVFSED